jgi:hypothetical protein
MNPGTTVQMACRKGKFMVQAELEFRNVPLDSYPPYRLSYNV